MKCSECKIELENGCLLDYTQGAIFIGRYAALDKFPTSNRKLLWGVTEAEFRNERRVHANRCPGCNKITLFAQEFSDNKNVREVMNSKIYAMILVSFIISIAVLALTFVFATM